MGRKYAPLHTIHVQYATGEPAWHDKPDPSQPVPDTSDEDYKTTQEGRDFDG